MARLAQAIGVTLLAVGAAIGSPPPARGDAGWWGDLDKGQSVRLADVIAAPEGFRGRTITFVCVFHQREREFNPLRTRFNSERYDNVSVWPDGKAIWLAGDFEKDFPFLYVVRTHVQRDDLLRQPISTRIEVTGRIEAVLDGAPFIEMTSFRVTGHRLGQDVVEHMMRAENFARSSDPSAKEIAADNAQSALEDLPDLAPIYAARIRTRLAELLRATGRITDADRVLRGERLGPSGSGAPGEPDAADGTPASSLPGTPTDEAPIPGGGNLPGTPSDTAPLPDGALGSPAPALGTLPAGEVPMAPFAPSIPGTPVEAPAAAEQPNKNAGWVPPGTSSEREPAPPATNPGPAAPPAGQTPATTPPASTPFPPPAPVVAPEVVDPPLPPPAPGGKPPVRRPRLAGVK